MAESRDWKVGPNRRGNDDLMSGISDEEITGHTDEEYEEDIDDLDGHEEDDQTEESER